VSFNRVRALANRLEWQVDMVIENVAVQVDRSFEITSQKAKRTRDPLTKLGRREDVVEGDMRRIDGQDPLNRPQRGWL
jgi:hypothetical protein